jgi:SAM-dependent methyltransferase
MPYRRLGGTHFARSAGRHDPHIPGDLCGDRSNFVCLMNLVYETHDLWQSGPMIGDVRDSYDSMAERYTAVALGDIDRAIPDRDWLDEFAQLAALGDGPVADLGCGPGYVTNHLSELGLSVLGYDLSPALIAEAKRAFPHVKFEVGDMTALTIASSSFAGIVARYSLIHMPPNQLASVFAEFFRLLKPGAPVLVSFFAANAADRHGLPFDHAVVTAYELFPAAVASDLQDAGFADIKIGTRGPLQGERFLDHATILARRSNN